MFQHSHHNVEIEKDLKAKLQESFKETNNFILIDGSASISGVILEDFLSFAELFKDVSPKVLLFGNQQGARLINLNSPSSVERAKKGFGGTTYISPAFLRVLSDVSNEKSKVHKPVRLVILSDGRTNIDDDFLSSQLFKSIQAVSSDVIVDLFIMDFKSGAPLNMVTIFKENTENTSVHMVKTEINGWGQAIAEYTKHLNAEKMHVPCSNDNMSSQDIENTVYDLRVEFNKTAKELGELSSELSDLRRKFHSTSDKLLEISNKIKEMSATDQIKSPVMNKTGIKLYKSIKKI